MTDETNETTQDDRERLDLTRALLVGGHGWTESEVQEVVSTESEEYRTMDPIDFVGHALAKRQEANKPTPLEAAIERNRKKAGAPNVLRRPLPPASIRRNPWSAA